MKKRVLIISYYWPPSAGSGVQRWLKFSKFLPEHGYEPHVYTPLNPSFDLRDEELLADVSDQVVVVKRKITEPYALFKLFGGKKKGNTGLVNSDKKKSKFDQWSSWIRGNLFIPDPRVFWVKPSVKFLSQYVKEHRIDVVITTGPPHSMHLIGQGVKERTGIRWVVDMRDPFSKLDFLDTYSITDKNKKKYAKMEQDILNQCDHVLATSSSMPELLMPFDKNKFTCITNGFDPDDFPEKPASINREQFVVYHAGLLNSVRNPVQLWQAIRELLSENPDWASSWKIHLAGIVDQEIASQLQSDPILGQILLLEGYKKHSAVIDDYFRAGLLVLLVNNSDNSRVNIPGKLFEYLYAGTNILALGNLEADALKIVRQEGRGSTCEYADSQGIKTALKAGFRAWQKGETGITEQSNTYHRSNLTGDLAKLLDSLSQ